jgi:hypothetical protein
MLVFSVNASSYFGRVERSVAIGPSWRQETEKFEGSSLRPKGWPQLPSRACEKKQVTPGTFGSSKSLTQTLSLGVSRLKVVLTQARSSARATLDAARSKGRQIKPLSCAVSIHSEPLAGDVINGPSPPSRFGN